MLIERIFNIAALAILCGAVVPIIARLDNTNVELGASSAASTYANATILVVTLLMMLRIWQTARQYVGVLALIVAVVALATASVLWSDYPAITVRRSGSLVVATIWAWYFGARYEPREMISLIALSMAGMAILSAMVIALAPQIGIADLPDPPGWRGIFSQKNNLGAIMAIGTITCFYLVTTEPRTRIWALPALILCAGLLYKSESRTAWLIGLACPFVMSAFKLMNNRRHVAVMAWFAFVTILIPSAILVTDDLRFITELSGRDSTFTGRTPLWEELVGFIKERPILGFGFGGFWVEDSANVDYVWRSIGWMAPNAHNGWIDAAVELGVVGSLLVAVQLLSLMISATRGVVAGSTPAQYIAMLTFMLLMNNLMESNLVRVQSFFWASMVFGAVALAKMSRERKAAGDPRTLDPMADPSSAVSLAGT